MPAEVEWRECDVLVVGSGGAGSHAARAAAESGARVLVVSKDPVGCSDTKISEGIATVRQSAADDDSAETLSENLRMAGADLPSKAITDAFASDSQDAYDRYRQLGLRPSIDSQRARPQALPLPMGGHNRRRSVGHQNSGIAFGHANWEAVIQTSAVDYLEDAWFLDLVTSASETGKRVVGGLVYDAPRGMLVAVRASSVVIAAGGLSTIFFPKTDTMRGNTGDSYAIAARAGAELIDMEQVQFLPFCLASPPSYEGLLCGEPATASFLGVLRDSTGKVILDGVYLRTRAECSAAIMRAVEDGRGSPNGGAWLDMSANKEAPRSGPYFMQYLESCLPSAYRNARQALGKAAAKCEEAWEVRPSAHYHMGGIRVDENGASVNGVSGDQPIAGLFAAGQAMGGLFGANRLGSTSLTEGAVFGIRAGNAAAMHATKHPHSTARSDFESTINEMQALVGRGGKLSATAIKLALQQQSWSAIGPARTHERLQQFQQQLALWREQLADVAIADIGGWNQALIEYIELRNMLDVADIVCAAAMERDASVGGHVRLDKGEASFLSAPYSTVVKLNGDTFAASRLQREATPISRKLSVKFAEQRKRWQATLLRLMPMQIKDKTLEKRYRAIMGNSGRAPELIPGSTEAAVGERSPHERSPHEMAKH